MQTTLAWWLYHSTQAAAPRARETPPSVSQLGAVAFRVATWQQRALRVGIVLALLLMSWRASGVVRHPTYAFTSDGGGSQLSGVSDEKSFIRKLTGGTWAGRRAPVPLSPPSALALACAAERAARRDLWRRIRACRSSSRSCTPSISNTRLNSAWVGSERHTGSTPQPVAT